MDRRSSDPERAATSDVPVVVLCGGRGTRLGALGQDRPKPLVQVGERPVLWHVMRMYAHHGFRRFVLCLGHRAAEVERDRRVTEDPPADGWEVEFVDTGTDMGTGGRLAQLGDRLAGGTFAVAYTDCVSDVDLAAELAFHRAHRATGTVTAVRARSPYGHLTLDGERVEAFEEKPLLTDAWVSGGFFLFEAGFLDHLDHDPACFLEADPLAKLAAEDELRVFRHDGFWLGMDTPDTHAELERRWSGGAAPWMKWDR